MFERVGTAGLINILKQSAFYQSQVLTTKVFDHLDLCRLKKSLQINLEFNYGLIRTTESL